MREFKKKAQESLQKRIRSYGGTPGRAAGGKVRRDDGGNVTTVDKTTPPPPPTGNPEIDNLTQDIRRLRSVVAPWKGKRSPIDAPDHDKERPNFSTGGVTKSGVRKSK